MIWHSPSPKDSESQLSTKKPKQIPKLQVDSTERFRAGAAGRMGIQTAMTQSRACWQSFPEEYTHCLAEGASSSHIHHKESPFAHTVTSNLSFDHSLVLSPKTWASSPTSISKGFASGRKMAWRGQGCLAVRCVVLPYASGWRHSLYIMAALSRSRKLLLQGLQQHLLLVEVGSSIHPIPASPPCWVGLQLAPGSCR